MWCGKAPREPFIEQKPTVEVGVASPALLGVVVGLELGTSQLDIICYEILASIIGQLPRDSAHCVFWKTSAGWCAL